MPTKAFPALRFNIEMHSKKWLKIVNPENWFNHNKKCIPICKKRCWLYPICTRAFFTPSTRRCIFETEHLNTLDPKSEMILSFMSTLAQEESHTKSEIMNSSIEMRFRRGIFLTPPLLGYDQDENGDLVINPHEAKIVQLIFICIWMEAVLNKLLILWQNSVVKQKE